MRKKPIGGSNRGSIAWIVAVALFFPAYSGQTANASPPGQAFELTDALRVARQARAELKASSSRIEAARLRPVVVSALDDPVITPAIDHKPVDKMMRSDRSLSIEQSFPLSHIRSHKRAAAEADVGRVEGESRQVLLKIQSEVASAFFMLHERRRMVGILDKQVVLVGQLTRMAASRHASGSGGQLDVLRLEAESARLRNRQSLLQAETRSAEAMLNAAIGQPTGRAVPPLDTERLLRQIRNVPSTASALEQALQNHPGVQISQAEIARSRAEVEVMKSMYKPMAMVRVGKADTMAGGKGYMLMVGISVPIWFDRLKAGVGEARAMQSMAEADREGMLRMIEGETIAALESLRGAVTSLDTVGADIVPRTERLIAPAVAEYASGRAPLVNALEAIKASWQVEEDAAMAESALGVAWARYMNAVGSFAGESN
ncbi:TolC family protein [Pseudoduganella sp. OTU4001]|uniref:TolC family protein n=1 Tax=Pseudoduganella sp. OTU4001 TaxID=3043854 RepID=UPI00313C6F44